MANVREMKPVGKPSLTDEQRKKLQEAAAIAGDETRGLALALTFRGLVQNHAAQMQETVMTAFALSYQGTGAGAEEPAGMAQGIDCCCEGQRQSRQDGRT
jgi:hypothetical protein